ncbi:hypothetical protein [Nocardia transvalensis]|uniref:hypothetical protein n=1 Tax=Nocardia transvalensis TaxID=37333 RepID=UPI001895C97F|nr:hypothetical protein [Nocardia transvalensis]MBF6333544.1 hypothetical protein [Nocardia transvalensis]
MSGHQRRTIVVAVAPTGPDPLRHTAAEIAAIDTDTGQHWHLAVPLTPEQMAAADPDTLDSYAYSVRDVAGRATRDAAHFPESLRSLASALAGNTIAGAFPELAATFLADVLERWYLPPLWHHRFADIGTLTAGAWGIDPTAIPNLNVCCRLWGIVGYDLTCPVGEAAAVTACLQALAAHARRPRSTRPDDSRAHPPSAGPPGRSPAHRRPLPAQPHADHRGHPAPQHQGQHASVVPLRFIRGGVGS